MSFSKQREIWPQSATESCFRLLTLIHELGIFNYHFKALKSTSMCSIRSQLNPMRIDYKIEKL